MVGETAVQTKSLAAEKGISAPVGRYLLNGINTLPLLGICKISFLVFVNGFIIAIYSNHHVHFYIANHHASLRCSVPS